MRETSRVVKFDGGEVVVRRLSLVDLVAVARAPDPNDAAYARTLPAGFVLAALGIGEQIEVLKAVADLNGDLADQLKEAAEGMDAFRGGDGAGEGNGKVSGGPAGAVEDAPGEPAAPLAGEGAGPAGGVAG